MQMRCKVSARIAIDRKRDKNKNEKKNTKNNRGNRNSLLLWLLCMQYMCIKSYIDIVSGNHECSLLRKFISRFWRRWVRCKNSFRTHKPSREQLTAVAVGMPRAPRICNSPFTFTLFTRTFSDIFSSSSSSSSSALYSFFFSCDSSQHRSTRIHSICVALMAEWSHLYFAKRKKKWNVK